MIYARLSGSIPLPLNLIFLLCCATGIPPSFAQAQHQPHIAHTGATRVLTIFIQFKDDRTPGDPCVNFRGWPLFENPKTLPTFARNLLAHSPTPPFPDTSLTSYFYEQSNHSFTLYGDVYPEVITTDHERTWYHRRGSNPRGYGYLTREVLDQIDPHIDFAQYDNNPHDGVVDHLFLIVRRDPTATFTGVANLYGADAVQGRSPGALTYDGVSVDWNRSGSYIIHERPGHIISQPYYVRLLAHEYGHHLWNSEGHFPAHLRSIRTNAIPANGTDRLGYVLMAGRGGGYDARGDMLISPIERDLLGWADVERLNDPPQSITSVTIGDAYTTGDFKKIELPDEDPHTLDPVLYLANRQRIGPFDRIRNHQKMGCPFYEMGLLRTTGLLVQMYLPHPTGAQVDVLPADNTLALSIHNETYAGDLFGPDAQTQLTPWTHPNTHRPDGQPSWVALDRIRYTGNSNGQMGFDFIPDFRQHPTIREDSWMGAETEGYHFSAPLLITNTSTLHLASARLFLSKGITMGANTRVVLEKEATLTLKPSSFLRMERESTLEVRGTLRIEGQVRWDPSALITVVPGGQLIVANRLMVAFQTRTFRGKFD